MKLGGLIVGERSRGGGAPLPQREDARRQEDPAHERWDLEEGDEIVPGRYAVRLLGGGKRFEAYLAWDDDLHSLVVVKMLRPHRADDPRWLRDLEKEASIIDRLQHPVIMRAFDSVLDPPRPHLVLEFLEGPRLSRLLRKYGKLALEQLLPLGLQIASAMHYMGTRQILHLDIKPRNIIMGAPPRLIDLSVAVTFEEGKTLDVPVGTDAYMAPEQVRPVELGGVDHKADVWGLGVTLYESVEGRRPFSILEDDDGSAIDWGQLHEDPPPLSEDVPPRIAQLIMSMLERRPENRPEPAEVAAELEELVTFLPHKPVLGKLKPSLK